MTKILTNAIVMASVLVLGLAGVTSASVLDQSNNSGAVTRPFNHANETLWGQSFTPTLGQLDEIVINLQGPGLLFFLEVWACDPNAASNVDPRTGSVLGTAGLWSTAAPAGVPGPQTFVLDAPVDVSAYMDTPGSIMFTVTSALSFWGLIGTSQDDDYAGGSAYGFHSSGVWTKAPSVAMDLNFQTFGTAIPEPASLALLGLGGLMMMRRQRRTVK